MLDYDLSDKTAKARHDGFLKGFGMTEGSPEIAGTALTQANVETGQSAMENLLSAHPDINVVYTINEPAAQGAFLAIKRAAKDDRDLTSIDGSCSGVRSVADGTIGATVMQFPANMGTLAVESIVKAVNGGAKPSGINNSGTVLITDQSRRWHRVRRTPSGACKTAGESKRWRRLTGLRTDTGQDEGRRGRRQAIPPPASALDCGELAIARTVRLSGRPGRWWR